MTGLSFTAAQALFLLLVTGITVGVDAVIMRWPGRIPWRRALLFALAGLLPFAVVIAGSLVFVSTSFYERQLSWTMVMFLPLLFFFGLLVLAWIGKTLLLCRLAGVVAGLITGLVFPLLWSGFLGGLWPVLDALRAPSSLDEAVERGNTWYLRRTRNAQTRDEIFALGLRHANTDAVAMALDAGADPNAPLGRRGDSARTPLVLAIDGSQRSGDRKAAVVRLLLERGADPNRPSPEVVYYSSSPAVGQVETPLEVAAGNAAMEKILRDAGAR